MCALRILSILALGLGSASGASAANSRSCVLSTTTADLGSAYAKNVSQSFADISGGTITVGNATRVSITISGCDPAARYMLDFGSTAFTLAGSNGGGIPVIPVVVAVNGVSQAPTIKPVSFVGNGTLELVFAVSKADGLNMKPAAGVYSGMGQVTFVDF